MSNVFEGTRFCIHTFGCQMNKHDSERVAGMLEGLGSLPVETIEEADIVVFMTCCVREAADTRLYGQVASMKNIPLRDGTPLDKRYIAVGGCIACSIAYEHPLARVFATDIAPEAVSLARENAAALGLDGRVSVVECDLGEGVPAEAVGALDLVASNPPYVPTAVLAGIPREVAAYEPALALDGGADGLDMFRRLLAFCARALKPGGGFAFELHETCLDAAAALARDAGFSDVCIVNDLAGRPRVLVGRAARA